MHTFGVANSRLHTPDLLKTSKLKKLCENGGLVGKHVCVYWPMDGLSFCGTVLQTQGASPGAPCWAEFSELPEVEEEDEAGFVIRYDDGELQFERVCDNDSRPCRLLTAADVRTSRLGFLIDDLFGCSCLDVLRQVPSGEPASSGEVIMGSAAGAASAPQPGTEIWYRCASKQRGTVWCPAKLVSRVPSWPGWWRASMDKCSVVLCGDDDDADKSNLDSAAGECS